MNVASECEIQHIYTINMHKVVTNCVTTGRAVH